METRPCSTAAALCADRNTLGLGADFVPLGSFSAAVSSAPITHFSVDVPAGCREEECGHQARPWGKVELKTPQLCWSSPHHCDLKCGEDTSYFEGKVLDTFINIHTYKYYRSRAQGLEMEVPAGANRYGNGIKCVGTQSQNWHGQWGQG